MLARLKIGTALSIGFALALGVSLVIVFSAWLGLRGVERGVNDLSDLALPNTRALAKVDEARATTQRYFNGLMLRRLTSDLRKGVWSSIDDAIKRFEEGRKEFEAIPSQPETDAAFKEVMQAAGPWLEEIHAGLTALKERERLLESGLSPESTQVQQADQRAWATYLETRKRGRPVDAAMAKVRAAMEKEARGQAEQAHTAAQQAQVTLLVTLAIGAALLVAISIVLTRGIDRIVKGLTTESGKLATAVQAGKLQVRGDAQAVHFQFRGVVEGMNQTMEAFAKPIRMSSENMERISQGDIPAQISERYEGDFEQIKQSLNRCIAAVAAVVADGKKLAAAAVEGKLTVRADAGRHQGDFRNIVAGFNGTLDAVMKPIGEATEVLERLAGRDLRARVKGSYQGDHAKITEALNATATALHDAMAQVAQSVDQVSSASAQIAASSQAVASGASEQASSLEETGSSLESMASMTKGAADNAQQASGLASTAKGAATEGSAAMEQMTGAMGKIKASAEGTSQIIKDINEIAFQTNLLALNAAVEAARAGEAGRGFAVVAEEVRSLALRSKEAANKTEELIRQSVREAGEGEVTARHVNDKLAEIVSSVTKVTDIVAEIAAASKEQSAGIEQVNKAMTQMNTVTQQNAASSEESSSAAAELSGQSEELAAMIGLFQLEGVATKRTQAARAKAAAAPAPQARKASQAQRRPAPARKSVRVPMPAPEDVIPMDDDVAFKEF